MTTLRKMALSIIFAAICGFAANATVYTAVVSGNFNSALTWGGVLPSSLLTADVVIIPPGITVTLTTNQTFAGSSTLTVDGAINSTSGSALIITGGGLAGSGIITVDSVALGLTSGLTFTGDITAARFTSLGTSLSTAADIIVNNHLNLASGTLSLTGGSLTLGSGSFITRSGGALSIGGSGMLSLGSSYSVVYTASSTSGIELTGAGLAGLTVDVPGTVTLTTPVTVGGMLTLSSGTLALSGYTLTLGTGANVSASGIGTITGTAFSDLVINTSGSLTGALRFASGGAMLDDLTISLGGSGSTATLGTNLTLDGTLTLSSGSLSLGGNTLVLGTGADIAASGIGTLSGSGTSGLVIGTAGSLTGAIRFEASSAILSGLTITTGSSFATAALGTSLTVTGTLNLDNGLIKLGANNLNISAGGIITGGTSSSYVITDGTGNLVMNLVAGATDTFEVGTLTYYAPVAVAANSGSAAGNVSVNVVNGVRSSGTSGTLLSATESVVDATWHVASSASTGINYTLIAMWSAGMELNSFNRTSAYLSHYTSGAWDLTAASSAGTSGSMYTMTRAGITSLSPFMVTDGPVPAGTTNLFAGNEISVYPNPAGSTLYFSGTGINNVSVCDIFGKQVRSVSGADNSVSLSGLPAGTYFVRLIGDNLNTVKMIVKE